jgi:hypothetical protein
MDKKSQKCVGNTSIWHKALTIMKNSRILIIRYKNAQKGSDKYAKKSLPA